MGSWKRGSGGATEKMTTDKHVLAITTAQPWHDIWRGDLRDWLLTSGLHIMLLLIGAVLAARFVNWAAQKVTERLDVGFTESDALVRSEATKHRQAVASVISWVSVVLIAIGVAVQLADILEFSVQRVRSAGDGDRGCAGLRRPTAGEGPAVRVLHHPRKAVRLRRSGHAHHRLDDRSQRHRRECDAAGDQAALPGWRGVHGPERPDRQNGQPVQGLGARRRRHPGPGQRRPEHGQRRAAPGVRACDGRRAVGGAAAGCAHVDGRGKHRGRRRHFALGGAHVARQAIRGRPATAGAGGPGAGPRRRRDYAERHAVHGPGAAAPRTRRRARAVDESSC